VIEPYKGVDKDGNDAKDANAPLWLKFTKYNNLGNEFLFENSPKGVGGNYQGKVDSLLKPTTENEYRQGITDKSISFLGLYNINQFKESGKDFSYTFYVDTAYVRDETPMPQYMLALNPDFVETDTIYKQYRDSIWNSNGEVIDTNVSRIDTIYRTGFTRGFWVFNAQDSVGFSGTYPLNADYPGKFAYGAGETTRLAFVDGIHMEDTFYVLHPQLVPSKYLDAEGKIVTARIDSTFFWEIIPAQDKLYLGDNTHYYPRWHAESWNYDFKDGKYVVKSNAKAYNQERNGKSMVFQFRLVDPANDRRFLIESQRRISYNQDGEAVNPDVEIAPTAGRWLKIQNGVPVMSDVINIITARQNGAEIFDVTKGEVKSAVANEAAPTVSSTIQVIGNVGSATILNAGGKKVAISNILGQTVANQVVSSDNATIALPKGIVVVAVEGEAAVKAIVK
jgi:hypothetical protein